MAISSPTRMRRLMPLILWSSGGLSVLGAAFVVLWIWLPRWAPEWVVRYSPWVDPVLRAMAGEVAVRSRPIRFFEEYQQRITAWGSATRPEVITGLESPDPHYRLVCVWAVTDFQFRSLHPISVQDRLVTLALTDEFDDVRNLAYFALNREQSPRMSEVRARAMKDGEVWVRTEVVSGLDSRTSDLDWQTLLRALHDPNDNIRERAVRRVENLGEIRAVPHLMEMVHREEDRVLVAILSVLGHFKVVEAIPVLTGFLEGLRSDDIGPHSNHASTLFHTITKIDAAEGLLVQVKSLQNPDVGMRAIAAQGLGESADDRAIKPLTNQLDDPDPLVFGHVVIALSQLKAVSAMETILDRLETRRPKRIDLEIRQQKSLPILIGPLKKINFSDVVDQVAKFPLTPQQRERLERLREK